MTAMIGASMIAKMGVMLTCFQSGNGRACLITMKIPFAFATGYGERIAYPPSVEAVRKIVKPYTTDALRDALAGEP